MMNEPTKSTECIKTIRELIVEHDLYLKRAAQLETDLRAIGAIINDALNKQRPLPNPSFPSEPGRGISSGASGETYPHPLRVNKRPYD